MTDVKQQERIRDLVLSVVAYADLYDFPLTIDEIHFDLPSVSVSDDDLKSCLNNPNGLEHVLSSRNGMFFLKGRDYLVNLRDNKKQITQKLLGKHKSEIERICRLPWVRTVALTGSAAFDNARMGDDIDLFLIVKANRLWLVDLYNLFVIRIWRERILRKPKAVCINYIVDESAIALKERDFFTAHQVVHMKLFYDEGAWELFTDSNRWAYELFPSSRITDIKISKQPGFKKSMEFCFDILGAGFLNSLIYLARGKRLNRKRRDGILKGEYSLRRLKANDSRFGDIAQMRLVDSLRRLTNRDGILDNLLKPDVCRSNQNSIIDCITESGKSEIDKFIKYYVSRIPANETGRTDDEMLSLPFVERRNDKYGFWRPRARNFVKAMGLIRAIEPDGDGPVLDLGAGNCWLSRRLIETGYRTISLDPIMEGSTGLSAGDIFQKQPGVNLARVRGTMEEMPFANDSFKGIASSGSFHYSNNPSKTLAEIHRILKPDGWAVIYDSPVFINEIDGIQMLKEKYKFFDAGNALENIKYKPRWFIHLSEFINHANDAGFDVQIISTRTGVRHLADLVKNKLTSNRKWPQFPILLLTKKGRKPKSETPGLIKRLRYYHYKQFIEPRIMQSKEFQIDGIKLKARAGVFHPVPYDSSRILLNVLKKRHHELRGKRVLDMGTGSGIHAIAASRLGADVVAVDINPGAIKSGSDNAHLNRVGERIRFIQSNLFDNVKKEKFDLVIFNPPFYESKPESVADMAWFDSKNKTLISFLEQLPEYLEQSGEAIVILSDRMNLDRFAYHCKTSGLKFEIVKRKRVWDETYIVYSLTVGADDEN
jgi:HemK-related putative methylase